MRNRFFPYAASWDDQATALSFVRPGQPATVTVGGGVPIDQQLADSFNANNAVMAYVNGITNTILPTLGDHDWYKTFQQKFAEASEHAETWFTAVAPELTAIPQGIITYAALWSSYSTIINQSIAILKKNPKDSGAIESLRSSFGNLIEGVTSSKKLVTAFQTTIEAFAGQLTSDADVMGKAVKAAKDTSGADKAAIEKLSQDIDQLHSEIALWQIVVSGAAIAAGVSFFVGALICVFSLGIGLAVGIVGVAAGIAGAVAASQKVDSLTAEIQRDQNSMSDLNKQIGAITTLDKNLETLITISGKASKQMDLIIASWAELEKELGEVVTDLNKAEGDVTNLDLARLALDVQQADADWATLQKFCAELMKIKYSQANPAAVKLTPQRELAGVS